MEEHMQIIEKICADLKVKRLELVGSASRDDFQPERSDIDVLVEFEGIDHLFDRYFELKERLENQLGRQVRNVSSEMRHFHQEFSVAPNRFFEWGD